MSNLYTYQAIVDRVIDGDTVDMIVDYGFRLEQTQRIRLLHVDTPERGKPSWQEATDTLKFYLHAAAEKDPGGEGRLRLISHKTGKFGRWLGEIYSLDEEINVTAVMSHIWPYRN